MPAVIALPTVKEIKPVAPENFAGDLVQPGNPLFGIVWVNPERLSGTPCFYGTRVPLKNLFDYLEAGDPLADFLEGFPGVSREQAVAALELAHLGLLAEYLPPMKILLDHCVDWRLERSLPTHEVRSALDFGWNELKNGKLLAAAAEASFDVMLTVDRHIKEQQNLVYLPIAVVVLLVRSNRIADLLPIVPFLERALCVIKPGALVEIDEAGNTTVVTPAR